MKTQKLTKKEILKILVENHVYQTNIKTFANRHKKLNLDVEKCQKWLEAMEVKRILKGINEREKAEAKKFAMSLKQYRQLQSKAKKILSEWDTGHSMGCMKHLILFYHRNYIPFVTEDTTKEYSRNCGYKATHGEVRIYLTKKELIEIENIEGVWTLRGKNHTAKWLVSSGYKYTYTVSFEPGYLFGNSHGDTFISAKENFRLRYIQHQKKKSENEYTWEFENIYEKLK